MEINGKAYCFFEQSGTFKNQFRALGIPAEDYDIQNHFGETGHVCDLFAAIEDAYAGRPSLFDEITPDDIILAFFPCIHFCDAKTLMFKGVSTNMAKMSLAEKMQYNIELENDRHKFFLLLMKMVKVVADRKLRMIIENPWNRSHNSFLQCNFIEPSLIDKNRSMRGDRFVKATAYWFINCEPTHNYTCKRNHDVKIVNNCGKHGHKGICDEYRSYIEPEYARNLILDNILGVPTKYTVADMFESL